MTSSGIVFTPQLGGRKFRSLNKDHLQMEEEENIRSMDRKMIQEEGSSFWTCRDCGWKGKYNHKAKAHARDCGQRLRTHVKKCKVKKFECSGKDCVLSFALLSHLHEHYRYNFARGEKYSSTFGGGKFLYCLFCRSVHFTSQQGYNCIPFQITFTTWRSFKRHGELKHREGRRFCCPVCSYLTTRKDNMNRHQKRSHLSQKIVSSWLDFLLSRVIACKDIADNVGDKEGQELDVEVYHHVEKHVEAAENTKVM